MNIIATATATPMMRGMFTLNERVMLLLLLLLLMTVVVEIEVGLVVVSTYKLLVVPSINLQIHRTHRSMGFMETRGQRGGFSGVAHPHVL